jgi:microcystin-dependent protein
MALIITNNSPSSGYVAWSGLIIELKGTPYNVVDGNSNKVFLWWDADNPNTLQESNEQPTLTIDDCVVIYNNNGIAYFVPNSTIIQSALIKGNIGGDAIPSGVILIWSGSAENIPEGWILCDGQNGTPDLRDRFVVGAGASYLPGNTGGDNAVTLSISQIPSHRHTYMETYRTSKFGNKGDYYTAISSRSSYTSYTGGGSSHENRPPYYALCYIMKS